MQAKNLHVHQSFSFGGSEIEVWRGLVEDLCVYFLEPKNGYVVATEINALVTIFHKAQSAWNWY